MKFKKGYKYQLHENEKLATGFTLPDGVIGIHTDFIEMQRDGHMTVKKGYAWDGASGPTWDTDNSMTPSLFHDALYQLMRQGLLPYKYRKQADELFYRLCVERKMWAVRARLWLRCIRMFAADAAKKKRKIYEVE